MSNLLKIGFELTKGEQNSTLKMQVLKMPEKWRNSKSICFNEDRSVEIYSDAHPELSLYAEGYGSSFINIVFMPGISIEKDNIVASYVVNNLFHDNLVNILKNIVATLSEFTRDSVPLNIFIPYNQRNWSREFTWQIKTVNKTHPLTSIFQQI